MTTTARRFHLVQYANDPQPRRIYFCDGRVGDTNICTQNEHPTTVPRCKNCHNNKLTKTEIQAMAPYEEKRIPATGIWYRRIASQSQAKQLCSLNLPDDSQCHSLVASAYKPRCATHKGM